MDITQTFQSFKNEWADQGKRIDFDHVYQYQCVDLILQYIYQCFGLTHVRGNAIDYWYSPSPELLTKFVKIGTNLPQIGDIVVLSFDHIGISNGVIEGNSFQMIDENGGNLHDGDGVGSDSIETHTYGRQYILGVLRPIGVSYGVAPASSPAPANTINRIGQVLNLPPTISSWRIYRVGGPWTPGTEIATLNPKEFGGLSYGIVSSPAPNMFIIQTQMFGQVAIYAGADTPASFSDTAAYGSPNATSAPTPPPAPAPVPSNTEYTKLDQSLNLVTKASPTHVWDLGFADDAHATSLEDIAQGAPFVAYGKAQRTDGDRPAYFMTEADFGSADTTGAPTRNAGVNTVDLSPAPAPVATEVLAAETEAAIVPVRVEPADPEKWKQTYTAFLGTVDYVANSNATVKDLEGKLDDAQLVKRQPAKIAGSFDKDGQKYLRTLQSVVDNRWYGIPEGALTKVGKTADDNFINETLREVPKITAILARPSNRQPLIKFFATLDGLFTRVFHLK